ncbi:heat stress transcription factor B-2c-like [Canna indica]|uniref:Heat stress transcription factor B-2c-like n=1 Tax=Canna indica TaxID=4628 RepID=A0AAQ3L8R0_9LILI|nr:heat stress transcription factor B-2c-like [Canna indica]
MSPSPLPPAAEKAAEAAAAAAAASPPTPEGQRSLPTPFLTKTYQLVDDPSVDDMISWNEDGSTFVVWRPAEFARDLLPKYFKHNNFSSFVRQLNTYGFRKIVPDRWEFANDCFRRGEKRLLSDIHRRKLTPSAPPAAATIPVALPINRAGSPANSGEEQVLSSNSSPGPPHTSVAPGPSGSAELMEENERLRKENTRLSRELTQMKSLCGHIAALISKYANDGSGGEGGRVEAAEAGALPSTVLELMPGRLMEEEEEEEEEEDGEADAEAEATMQEDAAVKMESTSASPPLPGQSPRLFGVTIGEKRARDEEKGEGPTPEVKPEPKEGGGSPERHQQSWVVYCPRPIRRTCNGSGAVGEGDGART